jgi:uncharacterized MnhB-related membrane protein
MRERKGWKTGLGRFPACFVALSLLLAGLTLRAGQIEKDSKLATKIESKMRIRVLTPDGERSVRWPAVLGEGIASRETELGEQLAKGGVNPSTLIPWSDVRAIKVRKNAGALGALIGAGVVGASVAAMAAAMAAGDASLGEVLLGGLIFSPLGVLPGFLLGSLILHWKTVYKASAGPRPVPRIALAPTPKGGMALTVSVSF